MFVRTKTSGIYEYLQIVQNERIDGRIRQQVVATLGRLDVLQSAFSVRWLIESQLANDPNLNYDPAQGAVKAPLLLWGSYLWADGIKPRQGDGLVWTRGDLGADGTHPSPTGRQKVADLLLTFFKTDASTKPWFVKPKP